MLASEFCNFAEIAKKITAPCDNCDTACQGGITRTDTHTVTIADGAVGDETIIVDNLDTGASSTGAWLPSVGTNAFGSGSVYSRGAGDTYTFQVPRVSQQEVSMWWTVRASRSTNVQVQIFDGSTLLNTVTVNQQVNGGQWNSLGTFTFTGTARVVIIATGGGTTTSADAVRFTPTTPAPDPSPDPDPNLKDTITIKKAEYNVENKELRVEAFSSAQPDVVLTLEGYGQMEWKADKAKYEYRSKPVADPGDTVNITSDRGASLTVSVEYKD